MYHNPILESHHNQRMHCPDSSVVLFKLPVRYVLVQANCGHDRTAQLQMNALIGVRSASSCLIVPAYPLCCCACTHVQAAAITAGICVPYNTLLRWAPHTFLYRNSMGILKAQTWILNLQLSGAAILSASHLARSGFFCWLAEDSTSVRTQQAAQYADVLALATGAGAVIFIGGIAVLSPVVLFTASFAALGSTIFSKKVYHLYE
jgi:hypothetical protein